VNMLALGSGWLNSGQLNEEARCRNPDFSPGQ
jgi:hypothetical protein